ncbi:MAG: GFA family protein, partial [Alphaproteobacteria bacterium]|nr:GFA family protein [Alphaproteobacteria bacterium]
MIEASCHCGAVRMQIDEAPPEFLTDCNCSICRRNGGLWAYFGTDQVKLAAPQGTDVYVWGDKMIEFHRCRTCGNHT